jgi:regulator of cell morphogenesis and NO signaling
MTVLDIHTTVGQLVADRPARSRIFEQLGIDYCCGGKQPLATACSARNLDAATVLAMLQALEQQADDAQAVDAAAMPLADLCDHIEATHHAYLRQELPRLGAMIEKVATVHGQNHQWMLRLREVFNAFCQEIASHMAKEEQILFPMIRSIDAGHSRVAQHCGGLANPIRVMEHEHDSAGDGLAQMRSLTSDFTPPQDACGTFRAMIDGLRQLEADMHQHVHKENNVLFPRALQAEQSV